MTSAERDALLERLLRDHPDAPLTTTDADGRWCEVPASIRITNQRSGARFSGISAVEPGSRKLVFDALTNAARHGAASVWVSLVNGARAECHMIDVRHRHGVVVGILIGASPLDVDTLFEPDQAPPRTGHMEKDSVAVVRDADAQVCRMLGYERDELVGRRAIDLVHPDDRDHSIGLWLQLLETPDNTVRIRSRHLRGDGSWLWVEVTNHHLVDDDGETRITAEVTDVSEEMAALELLRQREELLTRLTEALPSGIAHVDRERTMVHTNARLHRILGVGAAATFDEQFATVCADDRDTLADGLRQVLTTGRAVDLEVRIDLTAATGQHRASVAIRVLTDEFHRPAGAVMAVDDVTDASALRSELQRRATVDGLTECLNRSAVLDELHRRLAEPRRAGHGTTVCLFDLDEFKQVNDTYGHLIGDLVLAGAAARVTAALRDGDVLGRLGGDEFLVVASGMPSSADAELIGRRVAEALAAPFEIDGGVRIEISASIGTAWSGQDDLTATQLIARADQAMYQAKRTTQSAAVAAVG